MDLEGKNYCGLTIDYNYDKEYVDISMPTYMHKFLKCFLQPAPKKPFYAPHKCTVPSYVQSTQYEKLPDNTPLIDKKGTKDIQARFGSLLYY